jgi:hypothetical protein
MGLDLVDIHFRIEKRFGVVLPFEEIGAYQTVGDIADAIERRVAASRQSQCVMLPAFLETRRFVRDFLALPELTLRPSTTIASLIPQDRRKECWESMWQWFGSPPPGLRLATACQLTVLAALLIAAYLAMFYGWSGLVSAFCLTVATVWATRHLPVVPPRHFATFGDVARRRASVSAATGKLINQLDLFPALQEELSAALGVETSELHRDARLKEDLDVG